MVENAFCVHMNHRGSQYICVACIIDVCIIDVCIVDVAASVCDQEAKKKTFTNWINLKLREGGFEPIKVRQLINLCHIM